MGKDIVHASVKAEDLIMYNYVLREVSVVVNGKNNNSWSVYAHINSIDGKIYIGITSVKPTKRWCNGNGYKYNPYFYNAIKKYGWSSFLHEVLITDLSEQEAKIIETELIKKYKTTDELFGYNLTLGGDGSKGRIVSDYTKDKIRKANTGFKHSDYTKMLISKSLIGNERAKGHRHSEDTKKRISESSAGNHYAKGFHHTDETRMKMSNAHKGIKMSDSAREKLIKRNTGRHLSDETKKKISDANRGNKYRVGSHHSNDAKEKMSISKKEMFNKNPEYAAHLSVINKIPVDMFSLDGEYIKTFASAKDAMNDLGIDNSSIIKTCKHKAKTAGGYVWRYHDCTN